MVGKIEVQNYIEHDDGSATVTFECDAAAKEALINEGLISLLEKAVSAEHNNVEVDIELEKVAEGYPPERSKKA